MSNEIELRRKVMNFTAAFYIKKIYSLYKGIKH